MSGFGVFRGSGATGAVATFEAWVGRRVTHVLDFTGRSTSSTEPWRGVEAPWPATRWDPARYRLVLSLAMLPNGRYTLSAGARGSYDVRFARCARYLVAHGHGDCIVRLGWEMNGLFYPWAAPGKEADFVAFWRRIHTTMRAEGFSGDFDWCPLAYKGTNASVERAYPGDAYVDVVGLDAYDTCPKTTLTGTDRWAWQRQAPVGLIWHAAFAARHGLLRSHPEWGVTLRPNDKLGGGDNPYYITQMLGLMAGSAVAYACLFDYDASDALHRMSPPTHFPKAATAFLAGT